MNEDKVSSSSDDNSGKRKWRWEKTHGGFEQDMNARSIEEDFAHREATVRGTGKRGRNGKTGGDDGKETDQKGHDDVREWKACNRQIRQVFSRTVPSRSFREDRTRVREGGHLREWGATMHLLS